MFEELQEMPNSGFPVSDGVQSCLRFHGKLQIRLIFLASMLL